MTEINRTKTIEALKNYDEARCALDLLNSEIHVAKQAVIPPEVQAALDDIDAEFEDVLKLASSQAEEKKKLAQAAIVDFGKSVKIPDLVSGTFVRGSITVPANQRSAFEKWLKSVPADVKRFFKFGNDYARIK